MALRDMWSSLYVLLVSGWELRATPMERFLVWGVPILLMFGLAAISELAIQQGLLLLPYTCAVALVAGISNRICVRSGLIAATTGALLLNWLLTLPGQTHLSASVQHGFHLPGAAEMLAWLLMYGIALFVAPRRRRISNPRIFDSGRDLPFTRQGNGEDDSRRSLHGQGYLFWDPPTVTNYEEGCDIGTAYGQILIGRVLHGEPRPCMAWIVRDMVARGLENYGSIEIGFLQAITSASRKALIEVHRRPSDPSPPR